MSSIELIFFLGSLNKTPLLSNLVSVLLEGDALGLAGVCPEHEVWVPPRRLGHVHLEGKVVRSSGVTSAVRDRGPVKVWVWPLN